jgi:NAD dependent epimerase/dehydratase family enzyme
VAPNPITNAELTRALSVAVHRPAWLPAPAFALRALLGEKASLVLQGQHALPAKLVAHQFPFDFPEIASAVNDLLR